MQITAPPIPFYRAASNRPPELSSIAAVRLKLLEQWRAIRAKGATAARFLDAIVARMPFPVKAIQVDGGSEFQGAFEEACKERGVLLFVLPPHSPKLNGSVERAHRRTWRSSTTSTMGS